MPNKRLEHLVAELNHAVHGKRSEKLDEDERQLLFEELEVAVACVQERKDTQVTGEDTPTRNRWRGGTWTICRNIWNGLNGLLNRLI